MKRANSSPSAKDIRVFGLVILIGFAIIGAILFKNGKAGLAENLWKGAGAVCMLAQLWPTGARPFYWVWMRLGMVVGFVMSRVVLTILFFGLVTPIALFFKMKKRDELKLKKPASPSYWQEHPAISDKKYYEHLF